MAGKKGARMRPESDGYAFKAALPADFKRLPDKKLVSQMDAVKVADGYACLFAGFWRHWRGEHGLGPWLKECV